MKENLLQDEFRHAFDAGDVETLRALRRDVFGETIRLAQSGCYHVLGKTVLLPDAGPMMSGSVLYSDPGRMKDLPPRQNTVVEILESDSLLAGKKLLDEGYNPAVLNFANRQTPGGGVLRGSGAQEENIFRRSNLFLSLYQFHWHGENFNVPRKREQYPLDRNTGGVYSPHVAVFRGMELDGYPLLEQPYQLGIVTVAALNRPPLKDREHLADDMVPPTMRKIRTIFRIALLHGHDALVLGAWGCGAFRNPPEHIARLFHEAMNEDEFKNRFRKIVFAVMDRKGIDRTADRKGNLEAFQAEFRDKAARTVAKTKKHPPVPEQDRLQRFRGMFWGLVVGDCLGSPIQFTPKDNHPFITEMEPCRSYRTPPGYWTDDSAMAFCVADSVIRCGGYDLRDIAGTFVRWYRRGYWSSLPHAFDIGHATQEAVYAIENGSLRNGYEESQGNGSIMRLAPSYILDYGKTDRTVLHEISDLTHDSTKVREVVDLMAEVLDEHMQGHRTSVQSVYESREQVNNSGWAVSTLQAALWAFHSTSTFEDGMIAAVNLGGDADSIGAVYGQVAGAFYGVDAIPKRWISAIKDRKKVDALIEAFLEVAANK